MKFLEFDVKNMAIIKSASDKSPFISGAVDYFGLHFTFDEEFAAISGAKAVEFIKNNNKGRKDLVDGKCAVPNWILADKEQFKMRVISGNTIGTKWASFPIDEGGLIMPEEPEEELPATMEYVKTFTGDEAAPLLRATTNGLEYSTNGEDWNSGVSGVPEVPSRPKDAIFGRTNGDWVRIDKMIEEAAGGGISEIKIDGTALTPVDGAVDIDLTAYAKTTDVASTYATQQSVSDLQTLTGTAETITDLDYSTTEISDVVTAFNGLLAALRARGVIS